MFTTLAVVALADLACWWAQWANNQEREAPLPQMG